MHGRNIIMGLVALAVLAGGGVLWLKDDSSGGTIEVTLPSATSTPVVELKAYISGAVPNPGVYSFLEGARVSDIVEAAGGFLPDADRDRVSLASRVRDEDHWHVPMIGEAAQVVTANAAPSSSSTSGKININSASEAELQTLPGIGPVIAERIVAYREANGPFATIEDLINVSRIGEATLENIRELIEAR